MGRKFKISLGLLAFLTVGFAGIISSLKSNPALFIKTALKPAQTYNPTKLPALTTELFAIRGNSEGKAAFIYVQGGPALGQNIDRKNPLLNIPDSQNLLRVHPLQTQMINGSVLNAKQTLAVQEGAYEHQLNVEILDRTVNYFKKMGKSVHVICHSYGTLICHEYLRSKPQVAEDLVLMGFPLDLDLRTFDVGRGEIIRWVDGVNPEREDPFPNFPLKSFVKPGLDDLFSNMFRLIETHAKKRYTVELAEIDLSHVTYVFGKYDEASRRPTSQELSFLDSKNVEIIEVTGGHYTMWSEHTMSQLLEKFENNTPIKPSITAAMSEVMERDGSVETIKWYREAKLSKIYGSLDEEALNFLAYRELDAGKVENAIKLFQLGTNEFPQSANAFDSLGEAYMVSKEFDKALTNYKYSLKLNPNNSHGKKMVRKLKKLTS